MLRLDIISLTITCQVANWDYKVGLKMLEVSSKIVMYHRKKLVCNIDKEVVFVFRAFNPFPVHASHVNVIHKTC